MHRYPHGVSFSVGATDDHPTLVLVEQQWPIWTTTAPADTPSSERGIVTRLDVDRGAPMPSRLNPYLTFAGNARAAMEFYRDVFGGELGLTTFGEFGASAGDQAEKVMHAQLETASGFVLMASDNMPGMELHPGDTMTVSLSGDDRDDLRRYWEALIEGGQVLMPLAKQVWGDEYGMCTDRFGVPWLVNIAGT
jgi:PhnB protein